MDGADRREYRGGRYVLVRPLGEGSQGQTFEAVDKREGRLVALKRFRVRDAKQWKDVELAEREARTLASLEHPLLPHYVEHFEEHGDLVLVMELIEGETVQALRKRAGASSAAEVRRMLEDAARALGYLHGRSPAVVHRDLKPANVIRCKDGAYAFVDFGAVRDRLKPEGGSTVVGTFGYMAPEQFQGRALPASDVYGIGATALTMLCGREPEELPHRGLAIDVARAVPRGTPRELVAALEAMLDPDPDRRASSVESALQRAGRVAKPDTRRVPPSDGSSHDERRAGREAERRARHARKAERRAERAERKRLRARRRARQAPFVARTLAKLALLIAALAVWLSVGVVVPVVLVLLSVVFGPALRRAASSCLRASRRAGQAIGHASDWLSGARPEHEAEAAGTNASRRERVRVSADESPREGSRLRVDSDEFEGDDFESEEQARRGVR